MATAQTGISTSKAFPALSDKEVQKLMNLGCTRQQIAAANKQATDALNARQRKLVMSYLRTTSPAKKEMKITLLGKTGAGKSATGNLILGAKVFTESGQTVSCTKKIQSDKCDVDDFRVTVIDTPGLFDTGRDLRHIYRKIKELIDGGIDGIFFVYSHGNPRYTAEEKSAFQQIQQLGVGGHSIADKCFVVMTYGEKMLKQYSLREYVERERRLGSDFGELLNYTVQRRVIAVENSDVTRYGRRKQRVQIIRMLTANNCSLYGGQCTENV